MATVIDGEPEIKTFMPDEAAFKRGLAGRKTRGLVWQIFFIASIVIALLALAALFLNVVNSSFGLVASTFEIDPDEVVEGGDLQAASAEQLAAAIVRIRPNPAKVLVRDSLSAVSTSEFTTRPLSDVLSGHTIPPGIESKTINELTPEELGAVLAANLSTDTMLTYVSADIVGEDVLETYPLFDSLFNRGAIEAEVIEEFGGEAENVEVYFRSWLRPSFIVTKQSSDPIATGISTALLGTLWIVTITVLIAFPIGVGAAIYLEEYSVSKNPWAERFARVIETNIRNLAGVPSIIYGLLGLAIFVRALSAITSGAFLGLDGNGRTILSASLTMALLVLPVIIINAQEAIRAVPSSIREASYGLGATRWQTIWKQVIPAAMPGILTGTILGMSRAIGETAPLVVIGASTAIFTDPNGPFSSFTALPIQIYQWTARPQPEFRAVAAAAIIVLLVLLLLLNTTAIFLRQYFRRQLQG